MASEHIAPPPASNSLSPSQNSGQQAHLNARRKYQSPPPALASMTPPPTSEAPSLMPHIARTPTPTHSHLSSPPPTVKIGYPTHLAMQETANASPPFSDDQIFSASIDELRTMLKDTTTALMDTTGALREARASAAHHNLQYNLLRMESSESVKRMEVELEMTQKEVEVMQNTSPLRGIGSLATPDTAGQITAAVSPSNSIILDLRNQTRLLQIENTSLRRRLDDAKLALLEREAILSEDNEQLRERIRDNRKHLNILRRSTALPEGSVLSNFSSPQNTRSMPNTQNTPFTSTPKTSDKVASLLLAHELLSQEITSRPSTPANRAPKRHVPGHTRGAHSLSSLPTTPQQQTSLRAKAYAPYYSNVKSAPHQRQQQQQQQQQPGFGQQRRRMSRDSTISASEPEDRILATSNAPNSSRAHVPRHTSIIESPASQEAASMLRRSSFRQSTSANSSQSQLPSAAASAAATKSSELLQSKLYGYPIKKSGYDNERRASKRKPSSETSPIGKEKKGRTDEGVGLGIDGWSSGRR